MLNRIFYLLCVYPPCHKCSIDSQILMKISISLQSQYNDDSVMFVSQLRASIYLYNLMPPSCCPCKPNKRTYSTAQNTWHCYARSIFESLSSYILKVKAKFRPRGIIKDEFLNVFVKPSLMQCSFVACQSQRVDIK